MISLPLVTIRNLIDQLCKANVRQSYETDGLVRNNERTNYAQNGSLQVSFPIYKTTHAYKSRSYKLVKIEIPFNDNYYRLPVSNLVFIHLGPMMSKVTVNLYLWLLLESNQQRCSRQRRRRWLHC